MNRGNREVWETIRRRFTVRNMSANENDHVTQRSMVTFQHSILVVKIDHFKVLAFSTESFPGIFEACNQSGELASYAAVVTQSSGCCQN